MDFLIFFIPTIFFISPGIIYINALYLLATVFSWPAVGLGDQAERNLDLMDM